jgi:tetratricopeptide (TPR) repeat protein
MLSWAVSSSVWVLAQLGEASEALNQHREADQLLERRAAGGIVGYRGWAYHSLGRACPLLGRFDEARRLAHRAAESSPGHHGFVAHALYLLGDIATHPDRFADERGKAHYHQALALAEPRGCAPSSPSPRPRRGLPAHRQAGAARERLTTATAMYREMNMRVLAGAGGGGAEGADPAIS